MKYHIAKDSQKTAYLQLYEQLRRDIVEGVFAYGTKLPSKRLLSEEAAVSLITVEHAYGILCDEGYVAAQERRGYFVVYRAEEFLSAEKTKSLPAPPPSPGRHKGGEFPFSVLAKTMRRVLSEQGEALLEKSPNHGIPLLREAICSYLGRNQGMSLHPSQIIIGSGAEYLYSLIAQLLGSGREFALEDPSYEKIRRVYQANGIPCHLLKLEQEGIVSRELEATPATVLHITPFHSYPSGITASASKRQEYLRWASGRQGYVIEDNYDSELTVSKKHEDTVFSLDKEGRVIYLNTFSQTVAPAIRVGYMVLPQHLLREFEQTLGFYSCTVPVFEQYVLAQLIQNGDFERHINRVRRARRKAKK